MIIFRLHCAVLIVLTVIGIMSLQDCHAAVRSSDMAEPGICIFCTKTTMLLHNLLDCER